MKLTVIGCGDAFGSGGRMNTCFHLEGDDLGVLIDCGASSLPALKLRNVNVEGIDVIIISHFHGDHYGGLPFILLDASIHGRTKKITIISPPGGRQRVEKLLELFYPGTEVLGKLNAEFIEYSPKTALVCGELTVTAYPVIHSEAALPHGLRITMQGKTIAYSGDTSWTDALLSISDKADLFICECNFYEREASGHINYLELFPKLNLITAGQILLTHFDTEMISRVSEVKVATAVDGQEIIL